MRKIIEIFKADIKDIFKNSSVVVVVLALCIIPSLYAWFNIDASWDPYGSTGNIKVAIVNNDDGASINEKDINVGNELVDKLKTNDNLGWQFVDKDTAMKGIKKGDYYAFIEIPKEFSKDLTSVITKDVKKGTINYTVNEKTNAIAPKITDKGASTIQLEVNQTIVKTISGILFDLFKEVGIKVEAEIPKLDEAKDLLVKTKGQFKNIDETLTLAEADIAKFETISKDVKDYVPKIDNTLGDMATISGNMSGFINSLQADIPKISTVLDDMLLLSKDVNSFINTSKQNVNNISPIIKNDLNLLSSVIKSFGDLFRGSSGILEGLHNIKVVPQAKLKLDMIYIANNSMLKLLKSIDRLTPLNLLGRTIHNLEAINSNIKSARAILDNISSKKIARKNGFDKLAALSDNMQNNISSISNNFDANVTTPITNIFDKAITTSSDIQATINSAKLKIPEVTSMLNNLEKTLNDVTKMITDVKSKLHLITESVDSANATMQKGKDSIAFAKENMPKAEKMIDEVLDTINKIENDKNIKDLLELSKGDNTNKQDFLREPVTISETKLYPMKNYGSAMTPFYTVLCLWVGLLLLTSLVSVEVTGSYKPYEVYFGRGLTYLCIAIIQALIVSLGNFIILGVSATNPILFVLCSVLTSVVFTFIVYTLVSVFGNVGKSLGIVLLVIQVAGSGGTFPVEVTPKFFQIVNPFLPFTYAISMLRECIGGIYSEIITEDILILIGYIFISIIVGITLKRPLNKVFEGFKENFSKSRLSE